jgi:hypothetical protein
MQPLIQILPRGAKLIPITRTYKRPYRKRDSPSIYNTPKKSNTYFSLQGLAVWSEASRLHGLVSFRSGQNKISSSQLPATSLGLLHTDMSDDSGLVMVPSQRVRPLVRLVEPWCRSLGSLRIAHGFGPNTTLSVLSAGKMTLVVRKSISDSMLYLRGFTL